MGYWDATRQYLSRHGRGPNCPFCGKEMFPQDDHGRFTCFCNLGGGFNTVTGKPIHTPKIQQVDTTGMSDEEKAKIPPINRLDSEVTAAEAKLLSILSQGPDAIGSPEYIAAYKVLDEERGE